MISANFINSIYLVSAILFMLGLKNLSSPATAKRGNSLSMSGMALAIMATLQVRTHRNNTSVPALQAIITDSETTAYD